jgi:hypothetical protein
VTNAGGRWHLEVRPRAQRQLERLPEKVATAIAEFVLGPLLEIRTVSATRCAANTLTTIGQSLHHSG